MPVRTAGVNDLPGLGGLKPNGDGGLPLGVLQRGRSYAAERCRSSADRVTADGRSNVGAASDVWSDDAIFSNGGCEEKLSPQSQMVFLGGVAAVPGFPSLIPDVERTWSVRLSGPSSGYLN